MKYAEYQKVKGDGRRYVIGGSYFTYKGVQYGNGTKLQYTFDFHKRVLMNANKNNPYWKPQYDYKMYEEYYTPKPVWFNQIYYYKGQERWGCGMLACDAPGMEIVPDRDFKEILIPVYYVEPPTPKELFDERMHDGTWINYIPGFIPVYICWMLFCLISNQWLTGWVLGTYLFLRLSYLKISGQEP